MPRVDDRNELPLLAVIVLNWNRPRETVQCIKAILASDYGRRFILLVDNGSSEESLGEIIRELESEAVVIPRSPDVDKTEPIVDKPATGTQARTSRRLEALSDEDTARRVFLIRNDRNLGYAGGNNIGIRFALSVLECELILLLNDDAQVTCGALTSLVESIGGDNQVGMVSPTVLFPADLFGEGIVESAGGRFASYFFRPRQVGYREPLTSLAGGLHDVDWIPGVCMLIRSQVFRTIGLLDESFFAYWEDVDFSMRARQAGYRLVCDRDALVYHRRGVGEHPALSYYFHGRNPFMLVRKHGTRVDKVLFMLLTVGSTLWTMAVASYRYRGGNVLREFLRGVAEGICLLLDP